MLARSFLLLAVLGLAGCDALEELQPDPSVPLTINSIRVEGLRLAPSSVTEWDSDGTAPDVFIELQNSAGASIARTQVVPNADVSQPLVVTFTTSPEAPSETAGLYIAAYDDDGGVLNSERMGISEAFTARDVQDANGELVLLDNRAANGRLATYTIVL